MAVVASLGSWARLNYTGACRSGRQILEPKVHFWMRISCAVETIARKLMAVHGIGVIWQLHLRASAAHNNGSWLSAMALIQVADAAEAHTRTRG